MGLVTPGLLTGICIAGMFLTSSWSWEICWVVVLGPACSFDAQAVTEVCMLMAGAVWNPAELHTAQLTHVC